MENEIDQSERVFTGKELCIIKAAETLFAQHGYEGTSVRDIARDANVNVAMISYYFKSKEGLLEAVMSARIAVGRIEIEHLLKDKTIDSLTKVERVVDGLVERMMKNKSFHRITMRAQLNEEHDGLNIMLTEQKRRNLELITKLISEGQKQKVFSKNIDIPLLVMTIIGTIYQATTSASYYMVAQDNHHNSEESCQEKLLKKLKTHLKKVVKATLTYEV
ncbi:MAG: TetR family transcriptional regulator [Chitinophagaceae bacterium]